jgi:hypothetical protein
MIAGAASLVAAVGVVLALMTFGRDSAGTLMVESTPPDVQVFLDEVKVSETTPFVRDLEPRTYVLTVKKAGYRDLVRPIKIVGGQVDSEVLVLEQAAGTASLIVRTTPVDLAVWINNQNTTKRTPATITPLRAAEYKLELKLDGEVVYSTSVKLGDGAAELVEIDITRIPPTLEVLSESQGVEVWIDGKKIGPPPVKLTNLAPGTVQVQVRKPKCESLVENIELKPAVTRKVKLSPKCPS